MTVAEKHHFARKPPRWVVHLVLDPLVIGVLMTGFWWKLVLTNQYTWLESPDLSYQVLPWFQFQAGEFRAGRIPLWDPYMWNGQPLIGQAQPGTAYPLNWLLFSLPQRDGWMKLSWLHWYFVVMHWMAAVFMYWLLRDLNLRRTAAVIGGMVFALSGFMGHIDWPQMLNGAVWFPLVFLFLLRALRGVKPVASAALSGLFLGFSWLSGHHQVPTYLSLTVACVWLFHIFQKKTVHWHWVRLAALSAAFAAASGALQILPAYEYGKRAKRWVGGDEPVGWNQKVPYSVHREYSFNAVSILGIVLPGWHRNAPAYLGISAFTFALLAIALLWKEFLVKLLTFIGIGGLLFALGEANVFHGVAYALLPLVEKARSPSMAAVIFNFSFSALIGFGINYLSYAIDAPWLRRTGFALCAFAALVYGGMWARGMVVGPQGLGDERMILTATFALLAAGLLTLWRNGSVAPGTLALLAGVLMVVELGIVTGAHLPHRLDKHRTIFLNKMQQHHELAAFLKRQGLVRTEIADEGIPFNFGDWHGIETYRGYLASITDNLHRLEMDEPRMLQMFSVKYTVRKEPQRPDQELVYKAEHGLNVYLNPGAFPRAWVIRDVKEWKDENVLRANLRDPNVDLLKTGFAERPPSGLSACAGEDAVQVKSHTSGGVVLEAKLPCRGMVVLNDTYYPGWRATVDGRPAQILEVNGGIRGVVADGGAHRIEFRYRPLSVILGAALTSLAVMAAAALWLISGRRLLGHVHG
ncbi:MAG: YfhO family protein [Bryobacteraceae bacterium]|nr:YfhO family protein [Bryobacteraceae bacterium]